MNQPTSELDEIRALIATIRPLGNDSGVVSQIPGWLESAQGGAAAPHIDHPRLSLFSATHGIAAGLALPPEINYDKFRGGCLDGTGRLTRLAQSINTDLRLYEMDGEDKSTNPLDEGQPALDDYDLVRCMAYGMMAVDPGLDLLALDGFGYGSSLSSRALIALYQKPPGDDLVVTRLLKLAGDRRGLDALAMIGGYEIAALAGAIIAARLAHCPVLIDAPQGLAALLTLMAENPALGDHCRLCGVAQGPVAGLNLGTPALAASEPGLTLACAIQQIRTCVILAEKPLAA